MDPGFRRDGKTLRNVEMRLRRLLALTSVAALLATSGTALAADKIRAGKAVQVSFPMSILDLGVQEGIFAKYNIDLDITSFGGDAKLQQAFVANAIDVG